MSSVTKQLRTGDIYQVISSLVVSCWHEPNNGAVMRILHGPDNGQSGEMHQIVV